MSSANDIASVTITRDTRTATKAGFGTPMIARFHQYWIDRVRSYTSADAIHEDGIPLDDPAYLIAQEIFSQDPSPPRVKIGRRETPFDQVIELTPATPSTGLSYHCTIDGDVCEYDALVSDVVADVCTAFAKVVNTAGDLDVDAIKTNGVSTAGVQTILAAALDGVIGDDTMDPPRSLRFVFDSHTDWDPTDVTVTGTNSRGDVISEIFRSGSSVTAIGVKLFASVTSLSIPAQTGTGGTYTLGVNARVDRGRYDAIIETGGSTAGIQTLTGASLNGFIGALPMSPPRALVFNFSAHTDWNATTAVVTGTDVNDATISENFAIPADTGGVVKGAKLFKTVVSVVIPAQTGTNGKFTLGYQARMIASGASTTKVVVTTTTSGQVLGYSDWKNTQGGTDTLSLFDATDDPDIADDLDLISDADPDWYGLLIDSNSKAEIMAAAAWIEAHTYLFGSQTADTATCSTGSTTDIGAALKANSYDRSFCDFHPTIGLKWLAAGLMGQMLPTDPGSETWAFKAIPGVTAYDVGDTAESALLAKNMGIYVTVKGLDMTRDGRVASGEFIDVVRFIDWVTARVQEAVIDLLVNNVKLPFTNKGRDVIVNAILAVLGQGVRQGGFEAGTIAASGLDVTDVDPSDRANRHYPGFEFSGRLAGAVHSTVMRGRVSV